MLIYMKILYTYKLCFLLCYSLTPTARLRNEMKEYYAHSGNDVNQWHLLREHLASVANLAKSYVMGWKGEEEAELDCCMI